MSTCSGSITWPSTTSSRVSSIGRQARPARRQGAVEVTGPAVPLVAIQRVALPLGMMGLPDDESLFAEVGHQLQVPA
jgi:hypothetical protein